MRYVEFMKKSSRCTTTCRFLLRSDARYEGRQAAHPLGCWARSSDPEYCNFDYRDMTEWGRKCS